MAKSTRKRKSDPEPDPQRFQRRRRSRDVHVIGKITRPPQQPEPEETTSDDVS